jgi:hypothetical protein
MSLPTGSGPDTGCNPRTEADVLFSRIILKNDRNTKGVKERVPASWTCALSKSSPSRSFRAGSAPWQIIGFFAERIYRQP